MKPRTWMMAFLALVALDNQVTGHNILMVLLFATPSHMNIFNPLAQELVQRGHQVTIMSPFQPSQDQQEGITHVFLEGAASALESHKSKVSFFNGKALDSSVLFNLISMLKDICNGTYRDPVVRDLLQDKPGGSATGKFPKYHLVVLDAILGEMGLPFAHLLHVPAVYVSPSIIFTSQAWSLDIPFPLSYVPHGGSFTTMPLSFQARMLNFLEAFGFGLYWRYSAIPSFDAIVREVFPDVPSLLELESRVAFFLTNTHPALQKSRPTMPYYVEIGGIHCHPAKPLPEDLEDFMASSGDDGVVYFSLGSYTRGESMPEDMKRKVLEAFSKLPQKVLWKYEGHIAELPPNVHLISWAPQQDLLAHPKLKLFITHGGMFSLHEAAYHGCPVLGFPLSADQWGNIASAVHAGFSEFLDWKTFTPEELLGTIWTMISDPRYKERALELSRLYQDNLQLPAETAAYWLEYVIRHQGAAHLKSSGAERLNFFQYFLLDVIGALLLILFNAFLLGCCLVHELRAWCHRHRGGNCPPDKLKRH